MRTDLAAVIPAYQCAETVGIVVAGVRSQLGRVVVVDDGSTDETGRVAADAGAEVLSLDRNQGKGRALREGIARAVAEPVAAVALLDADGQHDPRDLPALVAAWDRGEGEVVIGARLAAPETIPRSRYWANVIGSKILSRMTGCDLQDTQSGYRLLDADLLRRLDLRSDGYAIESEMLIKATARGARVVHVPVRTIYEGRPSGFRPLADTLRIAWLSVYFKVFDDP